MDEFIQLKVRVENLEGQLSSLRKAFSEFEKKIKSINVGVGPAGADADLVDNLVEEVQKIKEQLL